jgi:hypothetical protein
MNQGQVRANSPDVPFNTRLFERMRGVHREWLKNAQQIRELELDYGAKLMSARTPVQAAAICNEWMAKRMAVVVHEQEMFANSWVWLLAHVSEQPSGSSNPPGQCVGSPGPAAHSAFPTPLE